MCAKSEHKTVDDLWFDHWHDPVINKEYEVLRTMFADPRWTRQRSVRHLGDLLRYDERICAMTVDSGLFSLSELWTQALYSGGRILEGLKSVPVSNAFVVDHYLRCWNTLYYDADFVQWIERKAQGVDISPQALEEFHARIVEECFVCHRRDMPHYSATAFAVELEQQALWNGVVFVRCMLQRIEHFHERTKGTDILAVVVENLTNEQWNTVFSEHPNNAFLNNVPRGQRSVLLQHVSSSHERVRKI